MEGKQRHNIKFPKEDVAQQNLKSGQHARAARNAAEKTHKLQVHSRDTLKAKLPTI